MASVDMCEHDWPGSGCKECAAEAEAAMAPFREVAHRIVCEFRSSGWPAKEDEIARLLAREFKPRRV